MATTALSRGLSRVVSRSLRSEETDSTAERTGTGQEPPTLFFTLFHTGAWRILPYLLVSVLGVAVVIPALPVILTDYFAQRRQGGDTPVSCSSYPPAAQPSYCQDAHSDSVTWSSGASFVSNTIVAFFLTPFVGRLSDQLGRKPFMLASSVLSVLPLAVFFLSANNVISILWWFPAQVATAAVDKVSLAVAFTADLMPPSLRASTIGLVTASFACGIFVGPLISSRLTIQQITWTLPVFAAASLLWVVFAIPETTTAASRAEARASAAAAAAADTGALSGLASTWRIVMRSRLFLTLTAVMMVVGVVQEGLMDLLMQYLQIKVSFGVADNSAVLMVVGVGGLVSQVLLLRPLLHLLGEKRCSRKAPAT
uniref:Mfs general substrate transporter n=1 Tax=Tetraselmis sp. GSL018 TaxID=582737 RepID=A0A061RDA5_9CHLO